MWFPVNKIKCEQQKCEAANQNCTYKLSWHCWRKAWEVSIYVYKKRTNNCFIKKRIVFIIPRFSIFEVYILDIKFDWISFMGWVCAWVCNGVCLCLYVYVCVLFEIYSPKCPSTHFKDWIKDEQIKQLETLNTDLHQRLQGKTNLKELKTEGNLLKQEKTKQQNQKQQDAEQYHTLHV
jgi:hypothetical protein